MKFNKNTDWLKEDIDDDSEGIFADEPLDEIKNDEEQMHESDKEYYVVSKDNPNSKPYWVKKFNPDKHVLYKPDWPMQSKSTHAVQDSTNDKQANKLNQLKIDLRRAQDALEKTNDIFMKAQIKQTIARIKNELNTY